MSEKKNYFINKDGAVFMNCNELAKQLDVSDYELNKYIADRNSPLTLANDYIHEASVVKITNHFVTSYCRGAIEFQASLALVGVHKFLLDKANNEKVRMNKNHDIADIQVKLDKALKELEGMTRLRNQVFALESCVNILRSEVDRLERNQRPYPFYDITKKYEYKEPVIDPLFPPYRITCEMEKLLRSTSIGIDKPKQSIPNEPKVPLIMSKAALGELK